MPALAPDTWSGNMQCSFNAWYTQICADPPILRRLKVQFPLFFHPTALY